MEDIPIKYRRRNWAVQAGLTWTKIAKRLGVSVSRVSSIMSLGQAPQVHVDILRDEFHMPEELLPVLSPGRWRPSSDGYANLRKENDQLRLRVLELEGQAAPSS